MKHLLLLRAAVVLTGPAMKTFLISWQPVTLALSAGHWPSYTCQFRSEQLTSMLQQHRYVQVHNLHVPSCRCRTPVRLCMLGQRPEDMLAALLLTALYSPNAVAQLGVSSSIC